MARADLHVHTRYSDHPSEWFLQRLGVSESYTEPEDAYRIAKARGMDFVAITDHNRIDGALELKARHPDDVIVGVETTTYFPEDGCKVHVLLWGVTEQQFADVQDRRADIYRLRQYIVEHDIAHAVAHATFSVNGRLTADHLERLVLLFRSFEVLNGSRTRRQNTRWAAALEHLTPLLIASLARKHRIEPYPDGPWAKGATGGSDDHAGLLIGRAWTEAPASDHDGFLEAIRRRRTVAGGRHNDHRALAFSVYKIALDHSHSRSHTAGNLLVEHLNSVLFGSEGGPRTTSGIRRSIMKLKASRDPMGARLLALCDDLEQARHAELDKRFDIAHEHIARATGDLLGSVLKRSEISLESGSITGALQEASTALSVGFLAAPFITTMGALSRGRSALEEFTSRNALGAGSPRRVLWFTDTLTDLNGVSVTLQQLARTAEERRDPLTIVTCHQDSGVDLPSTVLSLPSAHAFTLPHYESYTLGVPSPLESIDIIQALEPDEIVVSTPGPTGLLGMAVARLLDVPCRFVYHTDYGAQISRITDDESLAAIVDSAVHWLCRQVDQVLVPSVAYGRRMLDEGLPEERVAIFRRGIDATTFSPQRTGRAWIASRWGVPHGPTLLYTGRVSREKQIDVLVATYERLLHDHPELNLLIVGDGPYLEDLRAMTAHLERAFLPGSVANSELPPVYSACDVLVFPSRTDTFGMSVLEAQACGTPAVVSDAGGPQDIVVDGVTGVVVRGESVDAWRGAVSGILKAMDDRPADHLEMCAAARENALRYDWHAFLDELVGPSGGSSATGAPRHAEEGIAL